MFLFLLLIFIEKIVVFFTWWSENVMLRLLKIEKIWNYKKRESSSEILYLLIFYLRRDYFSGIFLWWDLG